MKKIVILFLIFLSCQVSAFASKFKAVSLNEFTTTNPKADIKVYVYEDFYIHTQLLIPRSSVFVGKIINITEPKKGKTNAGFEFMPLYYMDDNKRKYKINLPMAAKYSYAADLYTDSNSDTEKYKKADKRIPGFKFIRNAYNGAKQRQKGIIGGATENVYKHSKASNIEKGGHIKIKKYDCFYLDFPGYSKEEYSFDKLFTQIDNYGNPLTEKVIKEQQMTDIPIDYPYEHQLNDRIYYLSKPKKLF